MSRAVSAPPSVELLSTKMISMLEWVWPVTESSAGRSMGPKLKHGMMTETRGDMRSRRAERFVPVDSRGGVFSHVRFIEIGPGGPSKAAPLARVLGLLRDPERPGLPARTPPISIGPLFAARSSWNSAKG